jgi:predicted small lipoprotein YifL
MKGLYVGLALAAACATAGCGQRDSAALPPATGAQAATAPPQCKNQRTKENYAQIRAKLKNRAGSFCIPEFGGFGGTIEYPGVKRPVTLELRSSTQNIYDEPLLGSSGSPIFYLNLRFLAGTHFHSKLKSGGGLTSSTIQAGQTYSAFGIVAVGHLVLMFPPCYAVATQGPYGGILPGIGQLFSDVTIVSAGYGVIEIYSGMQVSQGC